MGMIALLVLAFVLPYLRARRAGAASDKQREKTTR
jgi:hypothetical protein